MITGRLKASDRRQAVWESWADLESNSPDLIGQMMCLFVIGHVEKSDHEYPIASFDSAHFIDQDTSSLPVLTVPVLDGYNAVVEKYIHFAAWAVKHTNSQFLVKTDDDTFLRLPHLSTTLRSATQTRLYYGQFCTGI